jgi:hypothetical protein
MNRNLLFTECIEECVIPIGLTIEQNFDDLLKEAIEGKTESKLRYLYNRSKYQITNDIIFAKVLNDYYKAESRSKLLKAFSINPNIN